jgi:hypothetical protein
VADVHRRVRRRWGQTRFIMNAAARNFSSKPVKSLEIL